MIGGEASSQPGKAGRRRFEALDGRTGRWVALGWESQDVRESTAVDGVRTQGAHSATARVEQVSWG